MYSESDEYFPLARRLSVALTQRNLPVPPQAELTTALMDWFDYDDLDLARAILQGPPAQWHLLEFGAEPILRVHDVFSCAPSLAAALAYCLACIDEYRLYPDDVEYHEGVLELRAGDTLIVRLQALTYEAVPTPGRSRAESVVKGIRVTDDSQRLLHRLRKLPGLARLAPVGSPQAGEMRGCGLVPLATNWPGFMSELLKAMGILLPLSQAQDIAAEAFGFRDWQVLAARIQDPQAWLPPVKVQTSDPSSTRFYRDDLDALWGFAAACQGQAGLQTIGFSNGTYGGGYWHAEAGTDGTSARIGPSVVSGRLVGVDDASATYQDRAAGLLAQGETNWPQALGAMAGVGASAGRRLALSQARTNYVKTLLLEGWLFTLETATQRPKVKAELLDEHGWPHLPPFRGLLYPYPDRDAPVPFSDDPWVAEFFVLAETHAEALRQFAGAHIHWFEPGL